ncbi:hypothetical protein Tco_0134177 [Tanacetum coccineum]
MENEHELSYETLTRVYLGSYEHYKGVVAEVEHSKPGFELQGAKMVETGQNRDFRLRTARVTTPGLRKGPLRLKVCLKSEMGHVYKLGRDVEKLVDVVYKLGSSFGEVFGIGRGQNGHRSKSLLAQSICGISLDIEEERLCHGVA